MRALRLLRACVEFVVSGVHGEAHHRAAKNGSGTYRERGDPSLGRDSSEACMGVLVRTADRLAYLLA